MDKGTMITYRKLHKYSEPTRNKNIYENARTMREKMYKKMEMNDKQKEDEGMTITFWKINNFTFPWYHRIKNRFQICKKRQRSDPCG